MLRSEELCREGFEDIFKSAAAEIAKIYPEWTNYNTADPGVTILELMAWFTEIQRYNLSRINRGHYLRYLKLLGKTPRPSAPARTCLKLTGSGGVPAKTLFYADDIPFETEYECTAVPNEIASLESGGNFLDNKDRILSDCLGHSSNTAFYPFGKAPPHPPFKVVLENPLKGGDIVGIYFGIALSGSCAEIEDDFESFVSFHAMAGEHRADILLDETKGFSRSGVILVKIIEGGPREISFIIDSGEYAAAPIVSAAVLNAVPAVQKRTLSYVARFDDVAGGRIKTTLVPNEIFAVDGNRRIRVDNFSADGMEIVIKTDSYSSFEAVKYSEDFAEKRFIGRAYGLCDFKVSFDIKDVPEDSVELYICEDDGFYRWERTEDFDRADKFSRCFIYDHENGEFVFGSGEKGMPPRGDIYLFGCAVSLKERGSVKAGSVNSCDSTSGVSAVNILPSVGGRSPQSIEECFAEVREQIDTPRCCITKKDFENAVKAAPGIPSGRVKAFVSETKENCMCIAIESLIGAHNAKEGILRNIRKNLFSKVMVGTKVEFPAVRYSGINIYADVSADPCCSDCRELTERALREYFNSDKVNFGDTIRVNHISSHIYGLPWIKAVKSVDISVSASDGTRLPDGDIKLKNVCLPLAENATVTVSVD